MIIDPRTSRSLKNLEVMERKSAPLIANNVSFAEFLRMGNGDLSAFAAIRLYNRAMPLFNAVDMRATAFSQIPIRLWDKVAEEFIDDHAVLDRIAMPNADTSQVEFLEQIASFYDITGNYFMVATGRITAPPLELITIPPQFINFGFGSSFGLLSIPSTIDINIANSSSGTVLFKANETSQLGLRFISPLEDKEIWHMRSFSATRSGTNFWGMSRAQPVWLELEQYVAGNNTNLSMLKRGTRLSLAWVNNRGEELTEVQWDRLTEQAEKYAGDVNAGGTPILDGMDVKDIQSTNKDMEFKDLQEAMVSRISTVYGIPLPLLLSQSMTLNNLETSMLQFFDRAVLPLTNRLYNELSQFLLPRYPDTENLEFRFNEKDISALRARMIDTAKKQMEVAVNTDNELRTVMGYEALIEGGDTVFKPMGIAPIGVDGNTDDELNPGAVKSKFIQLLEQRGYSSIEANDLAEENFPRLESK